MPSSQLKRLKASLRESGVTGPQKSKQQKRKDAKDVTRRNQNISRAANLEKVREQFNPFENQASSRGPKHQFATNAKPKAAVLGRPGVTKSKAEKLRQERLLPALQARHKTGGIVDRRFGENDPSMTPGDRALERFMQEANRGSRKSGMFDLEEGDGEDDDGFLTHGGHALSFAKDARLDDYDESLSADSDLDADDQAARRAEKRLKRMAEAEGQSAGDDQDGSGRPKTKSEVMKEVIAKSKFHKAERRQAKEEDEDLRDELDAEFRGIQELLRGAGPKSSSNRDPAMNPERAALLNVKDKEYDQRMRQLAQDSRAKPTSRTKTEEEIAEENLKRLEDLERARILRMRGEEEPDGNEADQAEDADQDEDDEFGLGQGLAMQPNPQGSRDVESEDEFELDDDLIASGSDLDVSSEEDISGSDGEGEINAKDYEGDDDEAEFISGLLGAEDKGRKGFQTASASQADSQPQTNLSYTYPCPDSHADFLEITKGIDSMELITIVQRIRTLYHPKLDSQNKIKLAAFVGVLVDHIVYLANRPNLPPFAVLEQLIRHIHSLGKSFPIEAGDAFRKHTIEIRQNRSLSVTAGDLILFTAIGEIFSTSDHFHQVVTPVMLVMACYLGQGTLKTLGDMATGTFVCTQFLGYQKFSKRYIPEVLNFVLAGLESLAPVPPVAPIGQIPSRDLDAGFRISDSKIEARKLQFADVRFSEGLTGANAETLKHSLLEVLLQLSAHMAELWLGKSAYIEMMSPLSTILTHLLSKKCVSHLLPSTKALAKSTHTKVSRLLAQARLERQPLALHNHRPLPIKQRIPKFEDGYRPDKHYDPDRERSELAKLKKEHKRERKGAVRELRKDAHFIARESLRQKKVADAEYEKKYKRLVAEIQGEEAHEAKEYEREKRLRQGKR